MSATTINPFLLAGAHAHAIIHNLLPLFAPYILLYVISFQKLLYSPNILFPPASLSFVLFCSYYALWFCVRPAVDSVTLDDARTQTRRTRATQPPSRIDF